MLEFHLESDHNQYLDANIMEIDGKLKFTAGMKKGKSESAVFYHTSGELYAEDVDQHMAILPKINTPTVEVAFEDVQVSDPGVPVTED